MTVPRQQSSSSDRADQRRGRGSEDAGSTTEDSETEVDESWQRSEQVDADVDGKGEREWSSSSTARNEDTPASFSDGVLEVVAVEGVLHLGQIQVTYTE